MDLATSSGEVLSRRREVLKKFLTKEFPECLCDGRIDFEMLRRTLGEWVDDVGNERFGLSWPGKAWCMKVIQRSSIATLKPDKSNSVNFESTKNIFIEGDNLEVLKLLQKSYFGKIKVIYIDPPYNTGQEFIYSDKYTESIEAYLAYTNQTDKKGNKFSTNTDTTGRYHSNWLNMMYPRLYLARDMLREDGAIFISIDDHELSRLKELCDQIFGEENFKADIVWQKRYTRSNSTVDFTAVVEHILVYAKSEGFQVNLLSRTEEADARYSNPDNDLRGEWKGASFLSPSSPQDRPNLCYPIRNPNTGEIVRPTTNAWRRSKDAFDKLLADNRLYWGPDGKSAVPTIKMFLSEARGLTPTNFWSHGYAGHTDDGTKDLEALIAGKVFSHPKPVQLVRRILEHACNDPGGGDIILDFFAGSCVTAQAVMESNLEDGGNREFILVQLPEPVKNKTNAANAGFATIAEIGRERIRRVIDSAHKNSNEQLGLDQGRVTDLGFKAFRLDRSNFMTWDGLGDSMKEDDIVRLLERHVHHRREESTADDIVHEILLKAGFPLSAQVEVITLAGANVFSVEGGEVFIYLGKSMTSELVDALADANPSRVICLDESFNGNDQLKANAIQTFKTRSLMKKQEIIFQTL